MQKRLLHFFITVRALDTTIEWHFHLITVDHGVYEESQLVRALPPAWITSLVAQASYPFTGRYCSGFLTTDRVLPPRATVRHIPTTAAALVTDVLADFAKRLPHYR